jgi:hypothetical protein
MNLYSDYESLEEILSSLALGQGSAAGSGGNRLADISDETKGHFSSNEYAALTDIAKTLASHVEAAARELSLTAFASFENSLLQVCYI